MAQYLIPAENIRNGQFFSGPDEADHIIKVARARVGDEILIFDGKGNRYLCVIKAAEPGSVTGLLQEKLPNPEYNTRLSLCCGVAARPAFESILEHCTEAGVETFQPVMSSRVQFDLFSAWERRQPRLEQITVAACKQSGRGRLPAILKPEKLDDLIAAGGTCVFASPDGATPEETAKALAGKTDIKLFVGPEGGFTKGELEFVRSKGALFMSLGLYTLRAETACLAAVSGLLTRLG